MMKSCGVLLLGLLAVASSTTGVRIMPFGDSLTTCCHYCAVVKEILPPALADKLAEPPMAYSGYIRYLWHSLQMSQFPFEYVGRVNTCIKNSSKALRVPDDWQVRYEGYYGFTTRRLMKEVLPGALRSNDPDVVLLTAGTNDMIANPKEVVGAPQSTKRFSRPDVAFSNLKNMIRSILTSRGEVRCDSIHSRIPHVFVSIIPPINFAVLSATRAGRTLKGKGVRVAKYNNMIASLRNASALEGCAGTLIHDIPNAVLASRLHVVDLNAGMDIWGDFHGDGLHPNAHGEKKIASRFHQALLAVLVGHSKGDHAATISQVTSTAAIAIPTDLTMDRDSVAATESVKLATLSTIAVCCCFVWLVLRRRC